MKTKTTTSRPKSVPGKISCLFNMFPSRGFWQRVLSMWYPSDAGDAVLVRYPLDVDKRNKLQFKFTKYELTLIK